MKWLNSFTRVAEVQALCPETLLVSMGDRESDIHDLFALAARDPAGPKLLVRAERTRQRRVENDALWDFIGRQSPAGEITLHIPRRGNRMARTVVLPVRFSAVTLQPPRDSRLPPVDLWAVHLHEENTDDPEPIEWLLLTTVPAVSYTHLASRRLWRWKTFASVRHWKRLALWSWSP